MSNTIEELEKIKNSLFPDGGRIVNAEIVEAETIDSLPVTKEDNVEVPAVVAVNAETITKSDIVNNLIELDQSAGEILEHVKDIVLSELPESQKITETSKIISNRLDIQKAIYDMKFKDNDEIKKDAKKEFNSKIIKELIDAVKSQQPSTKA